MLRGLSAGHLVSGYVKQHLPILLVNHLATESDTQAALVKGASPCRRISSMMLHARSSTDVAAQLCASSSFEHQLEVCWPPPEQSGSRDKLWVLELHLRAIFPLHAMHAQVASAAALSCRLPGGE